LSRVLEREAIDYALIGGHAVNAWLEPRFTADVDIVVAAGPDDFDRLKQILAGEGFVVTREHGADQPSGPDFVRFESESSALILEVQAAKTQFQGEAIRRAGVGEAGVRIATVEDLIVMKLIADRAKDQIDLVGLAALPEIDWTYIEHWAEEWQILDRLQRIRDATRKS
jgi:predicted nucleotidyltransferase